ncbi:MAG: hypothetical protein K2K20_03045 [Lachnospiraceae bacterium]|nr:hypothetical protein [Lachnospiraceae bacterium]
MNKDFPLNRFDFSNLVEYVRTREELPKVITDTETGIEFYNADKISRDMLTELLENFNILDNLAQKDAQQEYKEHEQLGVENFQFEPSWVEITDEKVVICYVGIYVNTDFNLTFFKNSDEWVLGKC